MPTAAIIEKVRQLRSELAETPSAPDLDRLRQQLDVIVVEPLHVPHYHGLKDHVLSAYVHLELAHPALVALMRTLVQELDAVGL